MSTPGSKELDQNIVKVFKSVLEGIAIKNINTILDLICSCFNGGCDFDLLIWDNDNVTLGEGYDEQKCYEDEFIHIFLVSIKKILIPAEFYNSKL